MRYAQKHDVPFTTSSKEFDNQHEVINWIIDNQLSRRNINEDQKAYLIGKRYQEEKKEHGGDRKSEESRANRLPLKTAATIVEQSKVSHQTVKNAEKFANAVDKVAENVGINLQRQY